jgi:hypothetical protein
MLRFPEGVWTKEDSVAARDFFLRSQAGQKLLQIMKFNSPKIDLHAPRDTKYDQSIAKQTWEEGVDALAEFTVDRDEQTGETLPQHDFSTISGEKKFNE